MDVKIISILFYVLLAAIPIEITVSSAIVSKQLSSTAKLKQPQVRLTKPSSIKNTSHNEPTGEAPEEDIELALWDNGGDEESGMYSDSEVLGAIMQQARRSWKQEFDDSKNDKSTRPSASEDSEPIIEKSFNERAIPMIDDLDDEEFDSNAYPDIDQLADQHKYKDTMRQRDQLIVKRGTCWAFLILIILKVFVEHSRNLNVVFCVWIFVWEFKDKAYSMYLFVSRRSDRRTGGLVAAR